MDKSETDNEATARLRAALAKAKKLKGSGVDYGKLTVGAINKATKDKE